MLLTNDFTKFLKFYTRHNSRLHLDALLFISVDSGLKFFPSLLDIGGIPVLHRNFRTLPLSVAYPVIFFGGGGGGVQQIQLRTDREPREGGSGDSSPLVRGFTQFVIERNPHSD
jgi:hypothetical protein